MNAASKSRFYLSFATVAKGLKYQGDVPILRLLVSGTKLDSQAYEYGGVQVLGEKVQPELLAEMLRQAKAGTVTLLENHGSTLPMGDSVDAEIREGDGGLQELYVDFALDPKHPLVGVLINRMQSGYMPDCSVGLFVERVIEWDEAENGYVGKLTRGEFEHTALTRPGRAAYPDAEIEEVFLTETMEAAMKALAFVPKKRLEEAVAPLPPVPETRLAEQLWRYKSGQDKTTIQTLIFDKGKFSQEEAQAWAKSHGFASSGVDETDSSYRIRQIDPSEFKEGSFRTISLTGGVKAVVGRKKDQASKQAESNPAATDGGQHMSNVPRQKVAGGVAVRTPDEAAKEEAKPNPTEETPKETVIETLKEAKKEDEAEAKKEDEAEAEAKKEDEAEGEAKKGEAEMEAEAEAEGEATKGGHVSMEDVKAHMMEMRDLMKEALGPGSDPTDIQDLLADIYEDFDQLCEMLEAAGQVNAEAEGDAGAPPPPDDAPPPKPQKDDEADAPPPADGDADGDGNGDGDDAKPSGGGDVHVHAKPGSAVHVHNEGEGDMVVKKKDDSKVVKRVAETLKGEGHPLLAKMLLREIRKSNRRMEAIEKKLTHLDSEPAEAAPSRFNDDEILRRIGGAEADESDVVQQALKGLTDPRQRETLSRALGESLISGFHGGSNRK
jgi:phage head maturation protease